MNKFLWASLLILLTGCANEPPKCSDPKTIALLKSIITENIRTEARGGDLIKDFSDEELLSNMVIDSIRLTKVDETIKKNHCEAVLKIPAVIIEGDKEKIDAKKAEIGIDWFGITFGHDFLESKQSDYTLNISYESQLDDSDKHIVIINDFTDQVFLGLSLKFFRNLTTAYLYKNPTNEESKSTQEYESQTNENDIAGPAPAEAVPAPAEAVPAPAEAVPAPAEAVPASEYPAAAQ